MTKITRSFLAAATLLSAAGPARALIVFTYEAPGVQSSTVPGVTTETFDGKSQITVGGLNILGSDIGGYIGGTLREADSLGGAGGTGKYLFSGGVDSTTLSFLEPQAYFGFWWSAGDADNQLSFFDEDGFSLGSFTIGDVIGHIGAGSPYYGNPNPSQVDGDGNPLNPGEPYVYLNFTSDRADIRTVIFGGSNFDTDNHSVTTQVITPPGIPVTFRVNTPDGGSTAALSGLSLLGLAGLKRLAARKK